MSTQPKVCTTPEYHETHAYCPSCDWRAETLRERMEQHGPLVYARDLGADTPIFHRLMEGPTGDTFPACDVNDTLHFWGVLHVKHASVIGAGCRVCFPPREPVDNSSP